MNAVPASDVERHPWLRSFTSAPLEQLTRLLDGRAEIYPFTRADAVDAARMLFGHLPEGDVARAALSKAVLEWLEAARATPLSNQAAVQQRQIRRIIDAFDMVGSLGILDAAERLRRQYIRWRAWVDGMVVGTARDSRAAYFRMLVSTQIGLATRFADPDGMLPLWMRLCTGAGGDFPEHYLHIGLVGLRKLPLAAGRGDTPWISGVAEWALVREPSESEFMAVWRPLKRLYPSSPSILRRQIYGLLSQPAFKDAEIEPPGWWRADPEFPQAQDRATISFEPPPHGPRERLIEAIQMGRPFRLIEPRLLQLIQSHRLYAARSGDADYLTRTFCNIGRRLIESRGDEYEERVRYAELLARETLNHRPFDIFGWSLWRDALAAGGAYDAARDLGWEIIRRFPNDTRTRNILAELMIAGGEIPEALKLVKQSINDDVADAASYHLLARIEVNNGSSKDAEAAVLKALEIEPDNERTLNFLRKLQAGLGMPIDSAHFTLAPAVRSSESEPAKDELIRNGRLRALRDQLSNDQSALNHLRLTVEEDPDFAYAQLLAARHGIWRVEQDTLPPVAAAFELALADEDRATLEQLAERAPRLHAIIHLARALFGDETSAAYIVKLLESEDDRPLVEGEKIIKFRLRPVLDLVREGTPSIEAIGTHRTRVLQTLYDANEALAAPELLAA